MLEIIAWEKLKTYDYFKEDTVALHGKLENFLRN